MAERPHFLHRLPVLFRAAKDSTTGFCLTPCFPLMRLPHGEDLHAAIVLILAVLAIWGGLAAVVVISISALTLLSVGAGKHTA